MHSEGKENRYGIIDFGESELVCLTLRCWCVCGNLHLHVQLRHLRLRPGNTHRCGGELLKNRENNIFNFFDFIILIYLFKQHDNKMFVVGF